MHNPRPFPMLATMALVAAVTLIPARPAAAYPLLEEEWATTDYEEAVALAKASNRLMLINFTGSDWCGGCILMEQEVFSRDDFQRWAEDNIVLLYLDFPRQKPQTKELKVQNEKLGLRFAPTGFPTILVFDPANGKEMDRQAGYGPGSKDAVLAKWSKLVKEKGEPKDIQIKPRPAKVSDSWFEGSAQQRERLSKLGSTAPSLADLTAWVQGDPVKLEDLKGKVVVLDFWATWSVPCLNAIPAKNALYEKYKDRGVVFIGIAHNQGADKVAAIVKEKGIKYPVAIDGDNKVFKAYAVNGAPDYYLIDRDGKLRAADVSNSALRIAVKALAYEPTEEEKANAGKPETKASDAAEEAGKAVAEEAKAPASE